MNCKVDLHREISSRAFTQTLSRLVQDRVSTSLLDVQYLLNLTDKCNATDYP